MQAANGATVFYERLLPTSRASLLTAASRSRAQTPPGSRHIGPCQHVGQPPCKPAGVLAVWANNASAGMPQLTKWRSRMPLDAILKVDRGFTW